MDIASPYSYDRLNIPYHGIVDVHAVYSESELRQALEIRNRVLVREQDLRRKSKRVSRKC